MQALARRVAAPIFILALFSSAALIFVLQPLFARMVTPLLGGSPAVWNASMAFFQAALLAGYLYAHLLARLRDLRLQAAIHGAVLLAAWLVLPVHVSTAFGAPDSNHPALWLVGVLTLSVGAPFAATSATAPLLQAWYARTGRVDAHDPYYLYAASNLGSFIGLLGYPVLIEPFFGAQAQSVGWAGGYALVTALMALSAFAAVSAHGGRETRGEHRFLSKDIDWKRRLYWIAAAAIPSSLILGVTLHISTDVASAPMLWVVPLALYLVTFIVAFMRNGAALEKTALTFHVPAVALLLASYYAAGNWIYALAGILTGYFFSALICHQALARSRPDAAHLTEFYLFTSLGGVVGGALTAFVAPIVFNNVYEYPLALAAACLFRPRVAPRMPRLAAASVAAVASMLIAVLILMRLTPTSTAVIMGAIGAAAALVAAGWGNGDEEGASPMRYAFLAVAAAQAGLMMFIAFNLDTMFVEVTRGQTTLTVLRAPWNLAALGVTFFTICFVAHATLQRARGNTLIPDIALGAALPPLVLVMMLGLLAERVDAQLIVILAILFAAVAMLLNGGRPWALASIVIAAFVVIFLDDVRGGRIITQERSFFGVLRTRVLEDRDDPTVPPLRVLLHGTTIHGAQIDAPTLSRQPLTYYNPNTALGEAILAGLATGDTSSLALIGLGAGSTACLMRPDDQLTIYEIDPAVVRLSALPGGDFTYVPQCMPHSHVELGDARLRIGDAPDGAYDVIVVDAFSSDAIPAHLLTREAIALYLRKTSARGIVVLHLSNRNLALVSEAARVARDLNAPTLYRISDRSSTPHARMFGGLPASVMIVARSPETLAVLPLASQWRIIAAPPGPGWTDDYIALPRALWENLNGSEECLVYPSERCAGAPAN
ncbi:MAG: fused MFS/spermidine synthase [Hyphomonadaceae bacterium]|nr:fused MFS/spermidine synthase [Hyphomonadaceae bacterium]